MLIINAPRTREQDRAEAFRDYARRRAAGEVLVPPTLLPPEERRLYVRRTLREDHQFRIQNHPEGAQAKFGKLAGSPLEFFRGTALLYYRDYAGEDADLPIVFTVGDVHPENFGVMPSEDGAPFFGVNDFDEACFAPFTCDVKRGAVGFYLVARQNGLKDKACRKVVRAWVKGYLNGLREFAQDDRERWFQYRLDNSPPMIRKLLKGAQRDRRAFLAKMVDLEKDRFLATDEIVPHSKHIAEFQKAIDTYRNEVDVALRDNPEGFFRVRDVALKKDSGTASLGLERYLVLIEGPSADPGDSIILEFKQARRSALFGLVPPFEALGKNKKKSTDTQKAADEEAQEEERVAAEVVRAHNIHLVGGDPFYGRAALGGRGFIVRERSPYKDKIDVDDLDAADMKRYARLCGQVLAQTHARSDEDTGAMQGQAETRILTAIEPVIFTDDVLGFAKAATKRVCRDYDALREDHALGAFSFFRHQP